MTAKRIIPCLDTENGRVVKGVKFANTKDVASPVDLAKFYIEEGADELVFYDITASHEGRAMFVDKLKEVAKLVSVPLTAGGAINTLDDFDRVMGAGANKVSVNSGAIQNPKLIEEAAKKYGSQCVVLSMDVALEDGKYVIYSKGYREKTELDALEWARRCQDMGVSEIVVNSIDADGVKTGFDIPMLAAVYGAVSVPLIASGGAGSIDHFVELFKALPGIDAGLAASVFHFREVSIPALKKELQANGIPVKL